MEQTNNLKFVDRLDRITVPISLRQKLNIELFDEIEIFMEEEYVIIKKFNTVRRSMVTGKVSETNREYAGGKLALSSEGARTLLKNLKIKLILDNET